MVPPFPVSNVRSHQIATGAAEVADQPWPSSKEAGVRNEMLTSLPERESRAMLNQAAGDRSPHQPGQQRCGAGHVQEESFRALAWRVWV